jgi:hypothetical protein
MNEDWRTKNTMGRGEMIKAAGIILSLLVAAILVLAVSIRLRNAGRQPQPVPSPAVPVKPAQPAQGTPK